MTTCIYFSFWWIIKSCQSPPLFQQLSIDICRWTWWSLRPLLCSNSTWRNRPEQHLNDLAVSTLLSEHITSKKKKGKSGNTLCVSSSERVKSVCCYCRSLSALSVLNDHTKLIQTHFHWSVSHISFSLSYVVLPKNLTTRDEEVKLSLWKSKKRVLFFSKLVISISKQKMKTAPKLLCAVVSSEKNIYFLQLPWEKKWIFFSLWSLPGDNMHAQIQLARRWV